MSACHVKSGNTNQREGRQYAKVVLPGILHHRALRHAGAAVPASSCLILLVKLVVTTVHKATTRTRAQHRAGSHILMRITRSPALAQYHQCTIDRMTLSVHYR